MPRPGRQLAQLKGAQFTAQRLLADRNAEFVEHPLRQVDHDREINPTMDPARIVNLSRHGML
jgi:hypothetical protein